MLTIYAMIFIPYGGQLYVKCIVDENEVWFSAPDKYVLGSLFKNVTAPTASYFPTNEPKHVALLEELSNIVLRRKADLSSSSYCYEEVSDNHFGPMRHVAGYEQANHRIRVEMHRVEEYPTST